MIGVALLGIVALFDSGSCFADEKAKKLEEALKELEADVDELFPDDRDRKSDLPAQVPQRFRPNYRFHDGADADEGEGVFGRASAADPSLLAGAEKVELIQVYDAARAPMNRHAGEPQAQEGAFAENALVGTSGAMMLWGPYAELEAGRHLVVYRFKFLDAVEGESICFLDVCHDAVTFSGRRPDSKEVPGGRWNELAIPLDVPETMKFEFRLWPQNHRIAIDRIYVYRLSSSRAAGLGESISVMGAATRSGFYKVGERDRTVARVIDAAGGGNGMAHAEDFSLWRRKAGKIKRVELDEADTRLKTPVKPGDIIWIPEK